jgi:hypothetical protein
MKKLLLVVVCALLSACAKPQLVKTEIQGSDNVVFVVPTEYASNGYLSGITLNLQPRTWYDSEAKASFQNGAGITTIDKNYIKLKYVNGMLSLSNSGELIGSYKEFLFRVDTTKTGESAKVQFQPIAQIIQPDTGLFKDKPVPPQNVDNAMALLSSSGTLTFQFEVDSTYNSESIFANFKRLLKEESYSKKSVEIMGKQFKSSYLLTSENKTLATCYVNIFPYKNGSKAVVIATAYLKPDSKYNVDAGKQIDTIKKLVSEVVNN